MNKRQVFRNRRNQPAPMPEKPKAIRFRIKLCDFKHEVWRVLDVPADMRLSHFHVALQITMGWQNVHCHEFKTERACYLNPREMDGQEGDALDERHITLAQFLQDPLNHKFVYRYDFGDCWDHAIELETIRDFDGPTSTPRCIAGAGACPPEDCGGSPGYERCRAAFELRGQLWTDNVTGTRLNQETVDLLRWMGNWDPLRFDLPAVNRKLKARFGRNRASRAPLMH